MAAICVCASSNFLSAMRMRTPRSTADSSASGKLREVRPRTVRARFGNPSRVSSSTNRSSFSAAKAVCKRPEARKLTMTRRIMRRILAAYFFRSRNVSLKSIDKDFQTGWMFRRGGLAAHDVLRRAGDEGLDVCGDNIPKALAGFEGGPGKVRRDDTARRTEQRVVGRRRFG